MIDTTHAVWIEIEAKANEVIEIAALRLKARGTPAIDTEFERGRISAMEELLEIAVPPKEIPFTGPDF